MSAPQAAAISFPREEALLIASLLALTGGYLDDWVYVTAGEWSKALHYVLALLAFVIGVIMALCLREFAPHKAPEISVVIVFLFIIAILHNRLPGIAGTIGRSFVATFQTASFPRVEGWSYNSVMATSNYCYTIEGLFAAFCWKLGGQTLSPALRVRSDVRRFRNGGRHRHDGSDARLQPRHSRDIARDRVVALRSKSNGRQEVVVAVHAGDLI